jgi:hypothetical protein
MLDPIGWKHLIIDVIFAEDEKTIKSVFADSELVSTNLTEEKLFAYLKELESQGWEFVHVHTRDQLYRVYYFKRRTTSQPASQ